MFPTTARVTSRAKRFRPRTFAPAAGRGRSLMAEYDIYGVTIASDFPLALPASRGQALFTIALRRASLGTVEDAIRGVPLTTCDDWFAYGLLADGRSYVRWR